MNLGWLRGLISIFPKLKELKNNSLLHINVTKNDNSTNVTLQADKVNIFWSALSQKEKDKFLTEIPKALEVGKVAIMDESTENLARDIKRNISAKPETELIEYFSGKIPGEDLYVLKAAIYIKKVFDKGGDIENLKNQIRYRYGRRGSNICNLYSAGYFESWIKPLYESLSLSPNSSGESFLEAYNLVVEEYPFAIFVHRSMTVQEIVTIADNKINICEKYGIKTLSIHGIGSENIASISSALESIKGKHKYQIQIEGRGTLIVAKIKIEK